MIEIKYLLLGLMLLVLVCGGCDDDDANKECTAEHEAACCDEHGFGNDSGDGGVCWVATDKTEQYCACLESGGCECPFD